MQSLLLPCRHRSEVSEVQSAQYPLIFCHFKNLQPTSLHLPVPVYMKYRPRATITVDTMVRPRGMTRLQRAGSEVTAQSTVIHCTSCSHAVI